jgi:hypothetical protein
MELYGLEVRTSERNFIWSSKNNNIGETENT